MTSQARSHREIALSIYQDHGYEEGDLSASSFVLDAGDGIPAFEKALDEAYKAGQESMRERAADAANRFLTIPGSQTGPLVAEYLRSLPVNGSEPTLNADEKDGV